MHLLRFHRGTLNGPLFNLGLCHWHGQHQHLPRMRLQSLNISSCIDRLYWKQVTRNKMAVIMRTMHSAVHRCKVGEEFSMLIPNSTIHQYCGIRDQHRKLQQHSFLPTVSPLCNTRASSTHSETGDGDSDDENDPVLKVYKRPVMVKTVSVIPGRGPPPEIPTTCCQSGCVNCVWIMYAEEMKKYYQDGGEEARKAIMQIEDPGLRCFLLLEIS